MQETQTEAAPTTDSIDQFDSQSFFKEHLVKQEDGSLTVTGENLNPMELALLDTEKRRRGSQASNSREKARADRAALELEKVKEGVINIQPTETIDPALKYSDPDEYIKQTMAAQGSNPYQEAFNTASQQATQETAQLTMEGALTAHNQANPTKQITPDMMSLDLPPRLLQEFQSGTMSPSDFLGQAANILYRPTEVANQPAPSMPDLGKVPGQTTPSDDGSNDKMLENYSQAVF